MSKTIQQTDAEIRAAVVKAMNRLQDEGKRLSGSFVAHNGNVILSICYYSEDEYSVTYTFYSNMWTWIIPKNELTDIPK